VFDPVAMASARRLPELRGVEFKDDAWETARGAHALAIVTEWNEFRNLSITKLKRLMKKPLLCDLRNLYDRDEVVAAGWQHIGVGRGAAPGERKPRGKKGGVRRAARKAAR